ncbi:MAG: response regulator [Oscillospiraceae bacterium]|nr:response regulator [Oscillospiraceae bacterium]
MFLVSALLMLALSIFAASMMRSVSAYMDEDIRLRLLAASRHLASRIEPEEVDQLRAPGDMGKPLYAEMKSRLITFADDNCVLYAYYYIPVMPEVGGEPMLQPVCDNDLTEDSYTLESEPLAMEEAPLEALMGTASTSQFSIYSAGFGGLLSAFAPVYSRDGESVVAIAGVDITDEQIISVRRLLRTTSIVLVVCVAAVIASGGFNTFLQIRRERQLRQALDAAVNASRAKGDFLSQMSHEMRTPMNAIIGMTTVLRDSSDIGACARGLKKIEGAAKHLLGVINDILDMSKMESGKLALSEEPFNFRAMIDDMFTIANFSAEIKNQTFTVDIDPSLPEYFVGDRQRLGQVVTNLLSNAIKFTPEGGSISLSARRHAASASPDAGREGCALMLSIKDTGIGISQEQMSRLFHSFEQADNSASRKYGGMGLGLAISKHIIELMGGSIWAKSQPGEGSEFTFTVTLPVAAAPVGESSGDCRRDTYDFSGYRALIAEDVDINREILEALLAPTKLQMDFAFNGREAVEKFKSAKARYDIVFMDIQMPEMDGFEAARAIRALPDPGSKATPIIAMTANVFSDDIKRVMDAGMDAHLGKPIIIDDVLRALAKYLDPEHLT